MTPFPWKQAMGFGLGVLRLSPQQFWSMTPRELACAIDTVTGRARPLDRGTLVRMPCPVSIEEVDQRTTVHRPNFARGFRRLQC